MKGTGKQAVFRGLAGLMAVLLVLMIGATQIAGSLSFYVNDFLGVSTTRVVANGEDSDAIYFTSEFSSVTELVETRDALNEQVVEEGAVLLKDENDSLPLSEGANVTLLGMGSHQSMYDMCTGAAALGNREQIVTYETAFAERGMNLNPTMIDFYTGLEETYKPEGPGGFGEWAGAGFVIGEVPMSEYGDTQISSFADYNDAAIIFIERNIGEGYDVPDTAFSDYFIDGDGEHDGLQLQNTERELIAMAEENFDTVIVLLNASNPIECGELQDDDQIDAIVWVGAVGTRGSYGIADLLLGNENFSGGLVDTYATDNHSAPAMMNYGDFKFANASEIPNQSYGISYIVEAEGVYVGYKYYETRYQDAILGQGNAASTAGTYASDGNWEYAKEVVYPFGYGLSYTTFDEEILDGSWNGDVYEVQVQATNTGNVTGKDNVQLYMQAPYTDYDKENLVEKPFTFIGCAKTGDLEPGASETVTISVDKELFASWDYVNAKTYILEDGTYYLAVGDNAHAAVNNALAAMGASGMTDEKGNAESGNTAAAMTMEISSTEYLDEGEDGTEVTNRFEDFSDLNSYQPDTVTYLSRQDWEGTYPVSYTEITAEGTTESGIDMLAELSGDTYEADTSKAIDFEYGNPEGTDYTVDMMIGVDDWDDEGWDQLLDQMTLEDYVALLFPLIDPADIGATSGFDVNYPGMTGAEGPTGMDTGYATEEDHNVTNTPYYMTAEEEEDPYLSTYNCDSMYQQMMLAATFNPDLAHRMGEIFGEDTLWAHSTAMEIGINNHRSAYSGRNAEYYSEDGNLNYIMCYQEAAGIQSKGGTAELKHYIGNDQETNRSGLATFCNEAAFREIQLRACEAAFKDAKAMRCMTSFSRIGVIQAAYCPELYEVVRKEWGVEYNQNMTDMAFNDLMYGARSVINGTDTFCSFSYAEGSTMSYYGILDAAALEKNADLADAARTAAKRTLYVWANSNDANGYSSAVSIETVTPWWQIALYVIDALLGVAAVAFAVVYFVMNRRGKKA